jgi:HK97 family phage portal protein
MNKLESWVARRVVGWLSTRSQTGNGNDIIKMITEAWGGGKTASGVSINEDKALTIGAVYTAVRIISDTMGALPLHVYQRDERGRKFAQRHWAYALLHDSPNEYHTSSQWRRIMIAHRLLWGRAYSRIDWLKNGAAGALYPLMPWTVQTRRTERGTQFYRVQLPDGHEDLPADEVLHFPGLCYDGIDGVSVIQKQREALGLSKAMEEFSSAFFGNGAKPGAILEVPARMKEEAQKNLALSIAEKFGRPSDAFKVMVLEEGSKLHTYTMPLEDAQLLDARKFSRGEIFGWYGVPPHLGGDTEKSTSWGTGIEQQDIGYAKHTITPLCVDFEQEINRKLFGRGTGFYCKFNLDALQRGDFKSRMEGYKSAVGRPFISVNEARELEDWNTIDGYDDIALPLNTGVGPGEEPPAPGSEPAGGDSGADDDGTPPKPEQKSTRSQQINVNHAPITVNLHQGEIRTVVPAQPAAQVTVNNQVDPVRPIVHVAPEVRNEIRVDVPPQEVNVHLPARIAESKIEYNAAGEIVKVSQTERDA